MFEKIKRKICFKKIAKAEDGVVMIVAALSLVAFLSVVSLVTDMGLKYHQKSKLQSAMDSAALAAVRYMPDEGKARSVALEYVEKNGFSADDVTVEFPTNDTVRVSDAIEGKTIFASLFDIDSVLIKAKAAAKFVDKNMAVDFDYLMFYGDNSQFTLNGGYKIGGSIFGNGNVHADGGAGSSISGTVFSANSATYNQYSITVGGVKSNAGKQPMPDFDETIMSVVPTANEGALGKTYSHIRANGRYLNKYSAGTSLNSVITINGSTYCSGNLTTGYGSELMTVYGDLYIEGDFTPQCPVYVTGNVYVGGNLTTSWGKDLKAGGSLWVEGNASLQGNTSVYGDYFYIGGNLNRGSTYSLLCECETYVNGNIRLDGKSTFNGDVYCGGDFVKGGSTSMSIKGNSFTKGKLDWQSGGTTVRGDVFVFGNGVSSDEDGAVISGPFTLDGDLYNSKGGLNLSGQGTYLMRSVIYSGGSISTNQGSSGIYLNGCMIAEKDVKIGGSTHSYNEGGATLSIYSRKGDITLYSQQGGFELWGIIYAPEGNVALATGSFDIHGSVIGDTISCTPGGLTMSYNDRELPYAKKIKTAVLIE
ncbi:MAG: pilus assembly protein TadG-related protein [Acutalibacteraceae bacterium]|nr:pilus assembly protein TadG-related protein [Acutalibacteraceae bacterium]